MNKKVVTGALIALAGLAAFVYACRKNRINEAAANAYHATKQAVLKSQGKIKNAFA